MQSNINNYFDNLARRAYDWNKMKTRLTRGAWSCFCGYLDRLKFRDVYCPCCRTRCSLAQPSDSARFAEMGAQLSLDYPLDLPRSLLLRLAAHHFWLVGQVRK